MSQAGLRQALDQKQRVLNQVKQGNKNIVETGWKNKQSAGGCRWH
jgi:hypothetical protein